MYSSLSQREITSPHTYIRCQWDIENANRKSKNSRSPVHTRTNQRLCDAYLRRRASPQQQARLPSVEESPSLFSLFGHSREEREKRAVFAEFQLVCGSGERLLAGFTALNSTRTERCLLPGDSSCARTTAISSLRPFSGVFRPLSRPLALLLAAPTLSPILPPLFFARARRRSAFFSNKIRSKIGLNRKSSCLHSLHH